MCQKLKSHITLAIQCFALKLAGWLVLTSLQVVPKEFLKNSHGKVLFSQRVKLYDPRITLATPKHCCIELRFGMFEDNNVLNSFP